MPIHHWMECYNVTGEPDDYDPLNVNITEYEGTHAVDGLGSSSDQFPCPLKIKKVNIGLIENMKLANIGDYWDDETVGKIVELLHEFQDMFPTKFLEMNGIVEYLGEIKIPLRPGTKLVKQRPYRLNL